MSDAAEVIRDLKAAVEKNTSEVKQTAESALQQAKESGQVAAETKAKADQLLTEQTALKAKLEEVLERVKETDKKVESARGREDGDRVGTFGEQVAASAELKQFVANGASGSVRVPVKQAITSAGGSAGGLIAPQREAQIVGLPRRPTRIRSLLNVGRTGSNLVEYAKMTTRTNNAAVVSETVEKPESAYVWTLADAPVRTIAHWVPISRQALDDAAQLQTEIDGELRYGLDRAEDDELLNGDGTGQHLNGLMTQAAAYVAAFVPDAPTIIDTLRLAILQLELADYDPDGMVLNPTDWARIELTKDGQERYIFANVLQLAGPVLWGRQVVSTAAQDVDAFLVGAFAQAATIYDRMDAEVLFSSEDRDNFVKNMITARAEKRLALAVKRPNALVKGDFGLET